MPNWFIRCQLCSYHTYAESLMLDHLRDAHGYTLDQIMTLHKETISDTYPTREYHVADPNGQTPLYNQREVGP